MKEPTCEDCRYFRQHYIKSGERFARVGCGHCVYPRLKHRKPDVLACVYFEPKQKTANSDASVHYREV